MRIVTSAPLLPLMLAAGIIVAAPARADVVAGKLQVSARVIVSCRLDARVPVMGSPGRAAGTAAFSVACTRGVQANAASCGADCTIAAASDEARTQLHIAENPGEGTAVATILF